MTPNDNDNGSAQTSEDPTVGSLVDPFVRSSEVSSDSSVVATGTRLTRTKAKPWIFVVTGVATVALIVGLWLALSPQTKLTTKQWTLANQTQLNSLSTALEVLSTSSSNTRAGVLAVINPIAMNFATLAQSNCPNSKLRADFTRTTRVMSTLITDLNTSTNSLKGTILGSDAASFIQVLIHTAKDFRKYLPRNSKWAVTLIGPRSILTPAQASACNADAKTVETATSAYNAQFTPSIGVETHITFGQPNTYGSGKSAKLLIQQQLLRMWPSASYGYAISLSTTIAGDVSVYVPANSTHPVDFESETSRTGCNS